MTKESTKKTWKGKVAKQWKRMQGSSSAPNTSYPEGGSIGKSNHFLFFVLCCSTVCCGLKIEGNMQCCSMYCFGNLDAFFFASYRVVYRKTLWTHCRFYLLIHVVWFIRNIVKSCTVWILIFCTVVSYI